MSLKTHIAALPENHQLQLALRFARLALPIWSRYTVGNKLEYTDTVVGLEHKVDPELLARSLNAVESWMADPQGEAPNLATLHKEFADPVVSLQDGDWELPYSVERTFYAVYNLLEKLNGREKSLQGEPFSFVIVNQATDALFTTKTMTDVQFREYLNQGFSD